MTQERQDFFITDASESLATGMKSLIQEYNLGEVASVRYNGTRNVLTVNCTASDYLLLLGITSQYAIYEPDKQLIHKTLEQALDKTRAQLPEGILPQPGQPIDDDQFPALFQQGFSSKMLQAHNKACGSKIDDCQRAFETSTPPQPPQQARATPTKQLDMRKVARTIADWVYRDFPKGAKAESTISPFSGPPQQLELSVKYGNYFRINPNCNPYNDRILPTHYFLVHELGGRAEKSASSLASTFRSHVGHQFVGDKLAGTASLTVDLGALREIMTKLGIDEDNFAQRLKTFTADEYAVRKFHWAKMSERAYD
jgi:hypothetical protein